MRGELGTTYDADTVQNVSAQFQNLELGQYGVPSAGSSSTTYPYPANYANYLPNQHYRQTNYVSRRSATPGPDSLSSNYYSTAMQLGGGLESPYSSSTRRDYAALQQQRQAAQTPAYNQNQSRGGPLHDPRRIRRSATAEPGISRTPLERSQTPSTSRNYKAVKPKDQRHYFKAGRVFKTFWTQPTAESNNPFGEYLRFVVIRPHKRHSLCLAFHTYNKRGTTRRHTSARNHLVVYSGDRQPELLPGEDPAILEGRPAIKVTLEPKVESLDPTTRLNLDKLYTFDHVNPITPVGKISTRDIEMVRRYCAEVQGLVPVETTSQPLVNIDEETINEEDE